MTEAQGKELRGWLDNDAFHEAGRQLPDSCVAAVTGLIYGEERVPHLFYVFLGVGVSAALQPRNVSLEDGVDLTERFAVVSWRRLWRRQARQTWYLSADLIAGKL